MAIHYAHLVMLAETGIVSPGPTRARFGPRSIAIDLADVQAAKLRRHLRGLCSSTSRRLIAGACGAGRRGTAAHRAQPQRHRHDDVPDAVATAGARPRGRDAVAAPRARRRRRPRIATTIFPAHTHTQPAQPTTVAHYLLARHRAARARHDAAAARRFDRRIAIRSARARSPARDFRSIASGRASCSASTVRRATPTAASRRWTTSSRARRRAVDLARRRRPARAGSAALVHRGSGLPAAGRRRSCR